MMEELKYNSYKDTESQLSCSTKSSDEKIHKLSDEEKKKEEEKIWADIIGDGLRWKEMTAKQKFQRVTLNICKIILVLGFLYFFICSLGLLSTAFKLISGKSTGTVMANDYISNPIVGLMIGILVTVLVQSSSTSTSIIVSMVAAQIISVEDAIPMVMGSNIGTSVTNTIVSLTQVGDREQFRRAFAGATVHDMFNWLAVIVLLPIEILTGMLYKLTSLLVNLLSGSGAEVKLLEVITDPFTELIIQIDYTIATCWGLGFLTDEESMIKKYCDYYPANVTAYPLLPTTLSPDEDNSTVLVPEECEPSNMVGVEHSCRFLFYETNMSDSTIGIILLIMSLTILCGSLICIVKILNSAMKGSIAKIIQKIINANIPYVPWLTGYIAIAIGAVLTFIVQSSSVFTSTMTPLIGLGIITLNRAYPLTLGSNIGTTTTALLAAMASEGNRSSSIQIALVHLCFNVIALLIFYPIPFMRWPIPLARGLGNITANYRWFAVFYLISMFFVLPASIFALSMGGPAVLWGVLGPVLLLVVVVLIINLLQNKKPKWLPSKLRSWDFLPEPLHSFEPYDRIFTSMPCCKKCRTEEDQDDVEEVITPEALDVKKENGIDNPVPVADS